MDRISQAANWIVSFFGFLIFLRINLKGNDFINSFKDLFYKNKNKK